jgi:hypothetical protein
VEWASPICYLALPATSSTWNQSPPSASNSLRAPSRSTVKQSRHRSGTPPDRNDTALSPPRKLNLYRSDSGLGRRRSPPSQPTVELCPCAADKRYSQVLLSNLFFKNKLLNSRFSSSFSHYRVTGYQKTNPVPIATDKIFFKITQSSQSNLFLF